MDYAKFQVAVIEIASEGTRLTLANVVARIGIDPSKADRMLDQMARDGRLDLEVDETEGVVVYHVRGLTPARAAVHPSVLDSLRSLGGDPGLARHVGTAMAFGRPFAKSRAMGLPRSLRRSVALGAVLGGLFPGAGLAYAAPWGVVLGATFFVWVGFKILAAATLFLAVPFVLGAMVISAVLGGVYTHRYNQHGRRSPIDGEAPRLARH
jgi:hypothetical protein